MANWEIGLNKAQRDFKLSMLLNKINDNWYEDSYCSLDGDTLKVHDGCKGCREEIAAKVAERFPSITVVDASNNGTNRGVNYIPVING